MQKEMSIKQLNQH